MYPEPQRALVEVDALSEHLCGRNRPGHFRGAATVLLKLFHILQPRLAFFGEKDSQQLAGVRCLVRDLNVPLQVVGVPTVRERDGLAMSSRNRRLSLKERPSRHISTRPCWRRGGRSRSDHPVGLRRGCHQGRTAWNRATRTGTLTRYRRKPTPMRLCVASVEPQQTRNGFRFEVPRGTEILKRLVKWADVLVVNFPHPVRKRLKLTYEDVAPWNPRLIYADLTGYGDTGPDADLPGFDITAFWARSGLLAMTRDAGAPPTLPVPAAGDHATASGS